MSPSPSKTETKPWLTVVGIGEDGFAGLSPQAQHAVRAATHLIGGARHLALVAAQTKAEAMVWPSPITEAMAYLRRHQQRRPVVLASGDPMSFGIGVLLSKTFGSENLLILPGKSCFTLACARLGWSKHEVATASLCGRPIAQLKPLIQPKTRLLVLSADETTPQKLATWLCSLGCGTTRLHVMEALDGPHERVRRFLAREVLPGDVHRLNLVALEIEADPEADPEAQLLTLSAGLSDRFFEHDGQLTKQEIRAATLAALGPRAGEVLWDLGAGSGSIGIEWMLRHPANMAFAVERHAGRVARILQNAENLGVPQLGVLHRNLPADLAELPPPDAIFVGGGVSVQGVFEQAWDQLKPTGRLVANAVTLEGEYRLMRAHQEHGGRLTRLSISRLEGVGRFSAFRPAMTVTQYVGVKL